MATERLTATTQPDAVYTLATYMDMDRWVTVDKEDATGVVLAEYDSRGRQVFETVAVFPERAPAHPLTDV